MSKLKILGVVIAAIQVVDIVIHAATNQLEPTRVSSNGIILVWLAVVAWGKLNARPRLFTLLVISVYFVLNVVFLFQEGVTNNGQLRVALLLLVALTVTLSTLFAYLLGRHE